MKIIKKTLIVLALLLTFISSVNITAISAKADEKIVQLDTVYTYMEMMEDIIVLLENYPQYIKLQFIGNTALGRPIPMLILGNEEAPHKVMVTSNIHAREYQCAPVAMAMVEYYANKYVEGKKLNVLANTCYYVVPMANPDGVCIAQFGAASVPTDKIDILAFVQSLAPYCGKWKANANGVDLNRCYNAGWEFVSNKISSPHYELWKGYYPESEPEAQALVNLANSYDFDCFVNFHQQGNVIYRGSNLGSDLVNAQSQQLAELIHNMNGYKLMSYGGNSKSSKSYGTFADWICMVKQRPSVTLEFGNRCPSIVSADSNGIFKKNKKLFEVVSDYLN